MGVCGIGNAKATQPIMPESFAFSVASHLPSGTSQQIQVTVPRLQIATSPLYKKRKTGSRSGSVTPMKNSESRHSSGMGFDR
jgi:hypothetical protein